MSGRKRLLTVCGTLAGATVALAAAGIAPTTGLTSHPVSGQPQTLVNAAQVAPLLPKGFLGGVIEGYYGAPWSLTDSQQMIRFLGTHHLNTYVYAPKDDPYQRNKWNLLYPDDQLTHLRALIKTANQSSVKFVYSISPGLTVTYSSDRDRAMLAAKVDQLRSLGVHVFMLSFDDIWRGLAAPDKARYGTDMAYAQSSFVNDLIARERPKDPEFQVLFTPTTYYGTKDNPYWHSLRVHLDKTVPVIWTGSWVLADQMQTSDVLGVRKLLGHPIVIWDNYPVNDFTYSIDKHPKLFMGPVVGRDSSLPSAVSGYLFNPMIQARASWVALWTGADYLTDPANYQPQTSWDQAIHALGGPAWRSFRWFAADASSYYHHDSAPVQLAFDERAFWSQPMDATLLNTPFYHDLLQMHVVNEDLARHLPDHALYLEIKPWAQLLSFQGQAGVQAVQTLIAYRTQHQTPSAAVERLQQDVDALRHNPNEIAGHVVIQFIEKTIAEMTQTPSTPTPRLATHQ